MKCSGLRKLVSIFLVITVLFSVASCNARGIANFQENMSAQEIIRNVVTAINDKRDTAESYSNIPESQRQGVTYSYYSEYLSIIRSMSSSRGNVNSFRLLTEDEVRSYVGDDVDYPIGNIIAAELLYNQEYDTPICVFLLNDNDKAYLSVDWIKDSIAIYSYSDYYFTMLDESNYAGVASLLRPSLDSSEYTEEAVLARANALIDFYQVKVKSMRTQYEVTKFFPTYLEVNIPEVFMDDGTHISSHKVSFTEIQSETYSIFDEIPFYADDVFLSIFKDNREMLRIGEHYSSDYVYNLFGNPISVSYHNLENSDDDYSEIILVDYRGLILIFHANSNEDGLWEGRLVTIRVSANCIFTVGRTLSAEMQKSEVLELLPYIENEDFCLRYSGFEVILRFDEDELQWIRITEK